MGRKTEATDGAHLDSFLPIGRSSLARDRRHATIAGGRFVLQNRLGGGAFGELFQAFDTRTRRSVAVKMEKRSKGKSMQLAYESRVYSALHRESIEEIGIPQMYYYGVETDYNVLVMELCGPSLDDLFNYCVKRFSLKTVCMLAEQMLQRLSFIHKRGFIHRDIKPENFVFGLGKNAHILYLIDFGLSKPFWDKQRKEHIPFCEGKSLTGTTRYCSTWTHRGYEQSRRDDMEAVGFLIVYFLSGSLPWQGIHAKDLYLKTVKIGEKKMSTSAEELCMGLPDQVLQYFRYCRALSFAERPNYNYLRGLFASLMGKDCNLQSMSVGLKYDWMFDWFLKRVVETGITVVSSSENEIGRISLTISEITKLSESKSSGDQGDSDVSVHVLQPQLNSDKYYAAY